LKFLVFLGILNIAWLWFIARKLFDQMMLLIQYFIDAVFRQITIPTGITTGIYFRFFELGFLDQIKIILVFYGPIVLLLPLTLVGVLLVLKKHRDSKPLMLLSFYTVSLWLFLGIQIVVTQSQGGLLEYIRIPVNTLVLSPIFCGLSLSQIKVERKTIKIVIISFIMLFSILGIFPPPQLIPPANVVVKSLPSNIPIVYVNNVNSIYQRSMIGFAESHIADGMIACDDVTWVQLFGMTNYVFMADHVLYHYYPFSRLLDQNITRREFDYFLIHNPGRSGSFKEKAEIRTPELISESIQNSSIIYNNGESYITTKPFIGFP
jgi:hypothetical protein